MSLVERYVSFYGDGAVYDSAKSMDGCRTDPEGPSCIVRVVMPKKDYLDVWYYTRRDNTGPNPLSDAYEAAGIVATSAVEQEVVSCESSWEPEECERLGGCYLCGSNHRDI